MEKVMNNIENNTGRVNEAENKEQADKTTTSMEENKETVKEYAKANGCEIVSMIRYEVGEGIEKKQENFAEEVMNQING